MRNTLLVFLVCSGTLLGAPGATSSPPPVQPASPSPETEPGPSPTPAAGPVESAPLTGEEILTRIDENVFARSKETLSRMVIVNRRGRKRTLKVRSWVRGRSEAFSEYLSPRKEKGTKMLKIGKDLWTYSPRSDRIIRIAGHLLRQPVMGSDLSYEDSLEEESLRVSYRVARVTPGEHEGRPIWVLDLEAREEGLAYPTKRMWVDRERFLPLRQEWFGKSGRLLKTVAATRVEQLEGRWYPTAVLFKDVLKSGRGTEILLDSIDFSPRFTERTFSRQNLRR